MTRLLIIILLTVSIFIYIFTFYNQARNTNFNYILKIFFGNIPYFFKKTSFKNIINSLILKYLKIITETVPK